jgi:hypothetical protein
MMKKQPAPPPVDPFEYECWLDSVIRLDEAAAIRGCCTETLKREARRGRLKLFNISERLLGARRRDILFLPKH